MVCPMAMPLLNPDVLREGSGLYVKGYEIEGLRTRFVIWRERYLDMINRTEVKVSYQLPEGLNVDLTNNRSCFPVFGVMSLQNLLEIVSIELQGTGVRPVAFSVEGNVMPATCLFSFINKLHTCKDGFISVACMTESFEEEVEDQAVEEELEDEAVDGLL